MNPFTELTWEALLFLIDRTDFSEPFQEFGLASRIQDAIIEAANGKVKDEIMRNVLQDILTKKGLS